MAALAQLKAGDARAEIGATGAELLSLVLGGRELIWPGDPALWPRRAPLLFPFCGWVTGGAYRAKGRTYQTTVHGFGPDATFAIAQIAPDRLRLTLADSEATRAQFPFAFALTVDVTLTPRAIVFEAEVANPGDEPLPYAIGFHPGFRWPFAGGERGDYRVHFEREETSISPVIAPGGLFAAETQPLPLAGRQFDIMAALARADSTVILNSSNTMLTFAAPDGPSITIRMENLPHWVFWSLPPAPFLCIEGWSGQGDPVGFTGDIFDKPGMIHLAPGIRSRHRFEICL